jgi:hypothetical protein
MWIVLLGGLAFLLLAASAKGEKPKTEVSVSECARLVSEAFLAQYKGTTVKTLIPPEPVFQSFIDCLNSAITSGAPLDSCLASFQVAAQDMITKGQSNVLVTQLRDLEKTGPTPEARAKAKLAADCLEKKV